MTLDWKGYTWTVYNQTGLLGQSWSEDHAWVNAKDRLVLQVADGVAGGVSMKGYDQVYGTFTVRFRMQPGEGSKYVCLLWPQTGPRPELDFAECSKDDPDRTYTTATLHRTMDPSGNTWFDSPLADFTRWREVTISWTPGLFWISLDGTPWASYRGDDVPSVPMHLAIQTASFAPGPPAKLVVDHVEITP